MARDPDMQLTAEEIEQRRDDAIRRALNTPPKPTKQLVGKRKRIERTARKATRSKPKDA
jgi:hypothetical protein